MLYCSCVAEKMLTLLHHMYGRHYMWQTLLAIFLLYFELIFDLKIISD